MSNHKLNQKFVEWDDLRDHLALLFRARDINRSEKMKQGIELLEFIIMNEKDASPVNFLERFNFIKNNTHNYSAFRQLDELFKETKKKIARLRVQNTKKENE